MADNDWDTLEYRQIHPCPDRAPLSRGQTIARCQLNDHPCSYESGFVCTWYDQFLKEEYEKEQREQCQK